MANRLLLRPEVSSINEVHTHNRCFVVAEGLAGPGDFNYGVHALNREDMYRGDLSDETIRGALQTTFTEKMRLFFVLNALEEEFRGQLSIAGYEGPKEEAVYQAEELEATEDYLKRFFSDCSEVRAIDEEKASREQVKAQSKEREEEISEAIKKFVETHSAAFEGSGTQNRFKLIALREHGKAHQSMLPQFRTWANKAIEKLTTEEKAAFDELRDTTVLSKKIEAANAQLEQAAGAFKAFFYRQSQAGMIQDINWSNLKTLFWESIKKQAYFEVSSDETSDLEIILNPSAPEAHLVASVINFLSHPENEQDIGPLLSALKLPDARAEEILVTVLARNGMLLQYAPNEFRGNKKVVLVATAQNCQALQFASDALKADRGLVLAAVAQNGRALQFARVFGHTQLKFATPLAMGI
ncbi:MAG: DUF4116 domain-containing protein [Gammaproteobacteria bacterium]|nr:DUF4116 domain-containing protein [Gammaproteobacteria bacterium]